MRLRRAGFAALVVAAAAGASAVRPATATRGACAGAALEPLVHTAASSRETVLDGLTAVMHAAPDRYALNAPQARALATARASLAATDAAVQAGCNATLTEFRAAVAPIYAGARVYWLRVPQTKEIEAADRLSAVAAGLAVVAARLAAYVRPKTPAAGALGAMRDQLAVANKLLGTAPQPAAHLATTARLEPAVDMTADDAALRRERLDLQHADAALVAAKADGLAVLDDLRARR